MKKWECTVCGYIHEGDQPPETCPKCGADKSKFIEVTSEQQAGEEAPQSAIQKIVTNNALLNLMVKMHAHPISVHIPNGVIPISVIFVIIAVFLNSEGLARAAFYNYIFVALSMPMVLFSGYVDWQKKYAGKLTTLFVVKITCGCIVTCLSVIIALWMMFDPQVTDAASTHRWSFLFVNLITLGAAAIAGHFGGKLVFKD